MTDLNLFADRSERLRQRHSSRFGEHVRDSIVLIADPAYLRTYSGQVTWAMLLNLIARLYVGVREIRIEVASGIVRESHAFFANDERDILSASLQLLRDLRGNEPFEGSPAIT